MHLLRTVFPPSARERLPNVLSLMYLGAVLVALLAVGVSTWQWMQQPFLGVFVEPTGYFSAARPARAGSWEGKKQGLGFPDRLLKIDQEIIHSTGQWNTILSQHRPGEWVTLLVQKADGRRTVVALPLQRFPPADRWLYFYLPYLIGWVFLAAGLWVYALRQWDLAGRLFAEAMASLALLLGGLLDALTIQHVVGFWSIALAFAGGGLCALALYFPRRTQLARRWPGLYRVFLVSGGVLGLWGLVAVYSWRWPRMYAQVWRVGYVYLGIGILALLSSALYQILKARSPLVREQAMLVLVSGLLAVPPWLVWALGAMLGIEMSFSPWLLLPLGVFPIGAGYAMARYRTLDVEVLLQRGGVYLILGALVTVSYGLVVAGLSVWLGARWVAARPWVTGLLAFLLAVLLQPAERALHRLINLLFARQSRLYRRHLEQFSEALIQAVNEAAIWGLVREYITRDLGARPVHLFVRDAGSGEYRSAVDEQGVTTSDVRFRPDSPFVRFLAQRGAPYFFGIEESLSPELQSEASRLALLQAVLFVPLPGHEGQELVGFLALGPRAAGRMYVAADVRYLGGLARQAALALERAQAATSLAHRVEQLNTLTRVAQGVNAAPTLEDLLELIAAQTSHLVPFTWLQIVLWDPQKERYYRALVIMGQERLTEHEQQFLEEGVGLWHKVLHEGTALRVEDYEHTCRLEGVLPEERGIWAWMAVPLTGERGFIGALAVGHHDSAIRYTKEQQDLIQAMADLASGAIVKAYLLRQSEQRARQLALLNELSRLLSGTLDVRELQKRVVTGARRLVGCRGARLWVADPRAEGGWRLAAVEGETPKQERPSAWALRAVEQEAPIRWPPEEPEGAQEPPVKDSHTVMAVPLLSQKEPLGLLEVVDKEDGSRFTADDGQLLLALASQAAVAFENARLYAQTDQALAARVEELSALELIDRELNASLDLAQAMRITLEWAVRRTGSPRGLIGLLRENTLRVLAAVGWPAEQEEIWRAEGLPLTLPGLRRAVQTLRLQHLRVAAGDHDFAVGSESPTQVVVPIPREGRAIGLLILENDHLEGYQDEDLEFLTRLVEHAAIAITNAQLYEAVQEANQAKSDFVSFVAHELKTPMTSIRGYADLLYSGVVGELNENQRNFLGIIRSNVERMAALVSDLADISRIEAGRLQLNFQRVSVAERVQEVVQSLGPQIEEKGQTLTLEVPEDLPEVWADPMRLTQVLSNLLSNAYKYTPQGGRIRLWAEVAHNQWDPEGPPQVVHVVVEDTGLGIHPREKARIFQRFFRSEADRDAREQPGTGLGLYITKTLVEMQGGRIWFESEFRKGTTFHFTIPVATVMQASEERGVSGG